MAKQNNTKGTTKATPAKATPAKAGTTGTTAKAGTTAPATGGPGRAAKFTPASVVTLVHNGNPKRPGHAAYARYNAYGNECKAGTTLTVAQALNNGVWKADLLYDLAKGFITIS